MKVNNVDLVFVIDASESMRPCFEGLARNLDQVLSPLQGFDFKVRLGLVAMSLGSSANGGRVVRTVTLAGDEAPIYQASAELFTEDGRQFGAKLRGIELAGDENHLVALDCALDFPFGPIANTRRVVALFSDEKIEDGMVSDQDKSRIPELIRKITDRKVLLFASLPFSPALEMLGSVNGAQIEPVEGGDGLASVNFGKLMVQMAKSISVSAMQGEEGTYKKALWGQDRWAAGAGSFTGHR
jgi:hypothetical protein